MNLARKRVGVLGGAFDPPHRAHQALAQAAVQQLQLDVLHVLPTGQAWHKARPLTPAPHRLAMTRLAFADIPQVVVDEREIRRAGPTFTVDTLRELKAENPGAELFLVLGKDQFDALTTWHAWQEIVKLAIICVADRFAPMPQGIATEPETVASCASASLHFRPLKMPAMPLSATLIRERIATQQDLTPLVCEPVARYIANHHLYQTL